MKRLLSLCSACRARAIHTETKPSPRTREDWKYLPQWRREKLSVQHKLSTTAELPPTDKITWQGSADKKPGDWDPRKRLSPTAMQGIKSLHARDPSYDVPHLASLFKVSPDAIRRILRSKWVPTVEENQRREERWRARGEQITEERKSLDTRYLERTGRVRNTVKRNEEARMRKFDIVPRRYIQEL